MIPVYITSQTQTSLLYRIRYPGFNIRVVCFSPDMQNVEGCSTTPVDQLFSINRQNRAAAGNADSMPRGQITRETVGDGVESIIDQMPYSLVRTQCFLFNLLFSIYFRKYNYG